MWQVFGNFSFSGTVSASRIPIYMHIIYLSKVRVKKLTYPLLYVSANTGYFVMRARQIAVYSADVGYSAAAYTRCESASPISLLTHLVMTFLSMYVVVAREKTVGMTPSTQDGFLLPDDRCGPGGVQLTCSDYRCGKGANDTKNTQD